MESLPAIGEPPSARFGHTVAVVSKTKAILFGGAVGLAGKYTIVGDTFAFDLVLKRWRRVSFHGQAPSPRAAHAACSVEPNQMVLYGGATGGGALASDDLYLLDLRGGEDEARWIIVPALGVTPGGRYGHSLSFAKPTLILYGGCGAGDPVSDIWTLNVERSPYMWTRVNLKGNSPTPRAYHSAALCSQGEAAGMLIIFGGRSADQTTLDDTWGLRRHRDGAWDWTRAPYARRGPTGRFQHSAFFFGHFMLLIGGRSATLGTPLPTEVYDTETSDLTSYPTFPRFRHASWLADSILYAHAGFEQSSPEEPVDSIVRIDLEALLKSTPAHAQAVTSLKRPEGRQLQRSPGPIVLHASHEKTKNEPSSPLLVKPKSTPVSNNKGPSVRLADHAHVAYSSPDHQGPQQVKIVALDQLQETTHRGSPTKQPTDKSAEKTRKIAKAVIDVLLHPKDWLPSADGSFPIPREEVSKLIAAFTSLMEKSPTALVRPRTPLKVYGSLFGQFGDLLRFFDMWGAPSDLPPDGDIDTMDYLFLGNYAVRGTNGLEVLCLLFALKLLHPEQIHLLRGVYEEESLAFRDGFAQECAERLADDPQSPDSIFKAFARSFELLPLAADIESHIFCVHGGIGSTLAKPSDLAKLKLPLSLAADAAAGPRAAALDLLWSQPGLADAEEDIVQHSKIPEATIYGPERIKDFVKSSGCDIIITGRDLEANGFGNLNYANIMNVFSATNFAGKAKNSAAMLTIRKDYEIIPKTIHPSFVRTKKWRDVPEEIESQHPSSKTSRRTSAAPHES
eukprot:TRINITY_DN6922_c0_g2_i1.p1 TRINITY_DN6922_c0_g2~~TRINITY_DN6922_c0_g2_i1.p1  ORF type:complete len:790 (+),score=105.53 TRINITY_DN6922_c0_g2_i1:1108-3477(+)